MPCIISQMDVRAENPGDRSVLWVVLPSGKIEKVGEYDYRMDADILGDQCLGNGEHVIILPVSYGVPRLRRPWFSRLLCR